MKRWMLVLQLGGLVAGWFGRASLDGKITHDEVLELVKEAAELYSEATGKQLEVDV